MNISSKAILVLFTCEVVFCLGTITSAQDWVARHNGPANGFDANWFGGLHVDDSGYVYRTGRSDAISSGPDIVVIKYSPAGGIVWERRYNGPGNEKDYGVSIASDHNGNVYVAGSSFGIGSDLDYVTIKYSPDGDTIWIRRYEGTGGDREWVRALAVDDFGNSYVTGDSWGIGSSNDYATIKYSPQGDTLWVRRYNGPANGDDVPQCLAVDDSGNVYVTGNSIGFDAKNHFATIKYSPEGDTLWVRHYDGPGGANDAAKSLVLDGDHNSYVTGGSSGLIPFDGPWDFATIKYSPEGDTLWVRRYNGPGNDDDASHGLAVDETGNVYVTGRSDDDASIPDYATIKLSVSGAPLWARLYDGPDNLEDVASALAIDNAGNVYVTGESWGSETGRDFATLKYSSSGELVWLRRYNGPGTGDDRARSITVDDSGLVYVAGQSVGAGTDVDIVTIKYRPCAVFTPGDVNTDGVISAADIICSVNYVFLGGAPPDPCEAAGDVDCTGACDSGDIIYTVNHVFKSGSLPCDVCNSALASACP